MKELQRIGGGYPRDMNYMIDLQDELFLAQNSLFGSIPKDVVLSGCAVTDHGNGTVSIGAGVVYVNGKVLRFEGAGNVPSNGTKVLAEGAPVITDSVKFQDTVFRSLYKETKAVIADLSSSRQILVKPILYSFKIYIDDVIASYGQKGETKWVLDLDGNFLDNFDSSGLGVTARWSGWALMNNNNGAPSMAGRTPIGVGAFVDQYGVERTYGYNATGGQPVHKLSVLEMPSHDHPVDNSNNQTGSGKFTAGGEFSEGTLKTKSAGGDQVHNNMQPYRAGYWVIKIA